MQFSIHREFVTECPHCHQPFVARGKVKLGSVRAMRCAACQQWVWQPQPTGNFLLGVVGRLVVVGIVGKMLVPSWSALLAWQTEPSLIGFAFVLIALLVINPIVFQFIAVKKQRQLKQSSTNPSDNRPIEI